jgi:1-aminocyclopropane-1-carboxylate deaminase
LPVGTGGTLAGLVVGLAGRCQVIGFSALKGGHFLTDAVATLIKQNAGRDYPNWHIETSYHEGGYGKTTPALIQLITEIENKSAVPLDPVYTAKMVMGVRALIAQKRFPRGSRILVLHTGGLQGRSGGSYTSTT